jgi:L-rhamnose mutarotase
MERHGSLIRLRPEKYEEYKRLHAAVWPEVLEMIHNCGIRNYTIYHKDGFLFSHFEYVGTDFAADMAKMAADPKTQEWWGHCTPCQDPLETRKPGEWWADMEELFHCD